MTSKRQLIKELTQAVADLTKVVLADRDCVLTRLDRLEKNAGLKRPKVKQ